MWDILRVGKISVFNFPEVEGDGIYFCILFKLLLVYFNWFLSSKVVSEYILKIFLSVDHKTTSFMGKKNYQFFIYLYFIINSKINQLWLLRNLPLANIYP